jgi:hypothetical protein
MNSRATVVKGKKMSRSHASVRNARAGFADSHMTAGTEGPRLSSAPAERFEQEAAELLRMAFELVSVVSARLNFDETELVEVRAELEQLRGALQTWSSFHRNPSGSESSQGSALL